MTTLQDWTDQSQLPMAEAAQLLVFCLAPKTTLDSLSWYLAHEHDQLEKKDQKALIALVNRRNAGEPLAYITHTAHFRDFELYVDKHVLIPRQETEELVELVINNIIDSYPLPTTHYPLTLADIGTGSGAIALSLAHWATKNRVPFHIIATDISQDALALARENVLHLTSSLSSEERVVEDRVRSSDPKIEFRRGSLLQPISEKIDCIIANLPYIPTREINKIDKNVRDFEPHLALDGGSDGLKLIRELLNDAPRILNNGGVIFLEVWHEHTLETFSEFKQQFEIEIRPDSFGKTRFAKLALH